MSPLVVVDNAVLYKPDNLIACTPNVLSVGIWYATCLPIIFIILPTITIAICNVIVFKIARSQYAKIKADAEMVAKFKGNIIEETENQISSVMHSTTTEESHEEVDTGSLDSRSYLTNDLASKKVETSNLPTTHKLMDVQLNREEIKSKNEKKGNTPKPESQKSNDVVANMQSNITSCKKRKKSTIIRGKLESSEEEKKSFQFTQNYKVFVSTLLLILVLIISQTPLLMTRIMNLIDKTLLTISAEAYITTALKIVYAINPLVVLLSRKDIRRNLR